MSGAIPVATSYVRAILDLTASAQSERTRFTVHPPNHNPSCEHHGRRESKPPLRPKDQVPCSLPRSHRAGWPTLERVLCPKAFQPRNARFLNEAVLFMVASQLHRSILSARQCDVKSK